MSAINSTTFAGSRLAPVFVMLTCPGCGAELADAGHADSTGIRWCTREAAQIADENRAAQMQRRRKLARLRAGIEFNLRVGGHRRVLEHPRAGFAYYIARGGLA